MEREREREGDGKREIEAERGFYYSVRVEEAGSEEESTREDAGCWDSAAGGGLSVKQLSSWQEKKNDTSVWKPQVRQNIHDFNYCFYCGF